METLWFKVQEWITFYGIKIIAALVIFIVGRWIAQAVRGLISRILTGRKVDPTIISFVENLAYIGMLVFVVIASLAQLGIQTTSFIAVIGAAGLAIGLALQGSLANFAAGFLMIIFKPFKAGDYIDGAGISGAVEKIEVFTTTLVTVDNKVIIVPNAKLMGDIVTNYSAKDTRRVDLDFMVSHANEIDKVRSCLLGVAGSDPRILKSPETVILLKELKEGMVFQLRSWVKGSDYWDVYFSVIETAKRQFVLQGIAAALPTQNVHVYDHGKA